MPSLIVESDGRPFVSQIRERLRAQIRSQVLKEGDKIPSMRRLAEQCGVSLGIVKHAVNTLTVEGYLRSHPGRGLFVTQPKQAARNIALVLPMLDFEQMPRIIRGVKAGLDKSSPRLLVQAADFDFDHEVDLVTNLDPSFVSGAIIYAPPIDSYADTLRELRRRAVPFVLIHNAFASLNVDQVQTNRVLLGRMPFEHVLERGHRKIGVIDHNGDTISHREMREGADEALRKFGLSFAELPRQVTDVKQLDSERPWALGEQAALQLLRDHPDLTAIVGMNDNLSLGVSRAVPATGRRIPEDVSIIAIGDQSAFRLSTPMVSAIEVPHEEMGKEAAKRLLAILAGDTCPLVLRLQPRIIDRGSVMKL